MNFLRLIRFPNLSDRTATILRSFQLGLNLKVVPLRNLRRDDSPILRSRCLDAVNCSKTRLNVFKLKHSITFREIALQLDSSSASPISEGWVPASGTCLLLQNSWRSQGATTRRVCYDTDISTDIHFTLVYSQDN